RVLRLGITLFQFPQNAIAALANANDARAFILGEELAQSQCLASTRRLDGRLQTSVAFFCALFGTQEQVCNGKPAVCCAFDLVKQCRWIGRCANDGWEPISNLFEQLNDFDFEFGHSIQSSWPQLRNN